MKERLKLNIIAIIKEVANEKCLRHRQCDKSYLRPGKLKCRRRWCFREDRLTKFMKFHTGSIWLKNLEASRKWLKFRSLLVMVPQLI